MVPGMGTVADEPSRLVGGRYRLLDCLGQGAMGPLWRADDELLELRVAVKQVLLPRRSTDRAELHQRVVAQARAAARLSHRNAVQVLDVVEHEGHPWIVIELLSGTDLGTLVRRDGPLPPRRAAEIGVAMVGALDAAHGTGLVHSDVKPGNVLLSGGRILLADFGIATLTGDPAYTAPERHRDDPPTPATDLWALGATLFFAVEGHPPFSYDTLAADPTVGTTRDPPPPQAAGALTPVLGGLLLRDPQRRLDAAGARYFLSQVAASDDQTAATAPPAAAVPLVPPSPPASPAVPLTGSARAAGE